VIAPCLAHYRYAAAGGLPLAEDFGIPVPGETVMIAAAVCARGGNERRRRPADHPVRNRRTRRAGAVAAVLLGRLAVGRLRGCRCDQ